MKARKAYLAAAAATALLGASAACGPKEGASEIAPPGDHGADRAAREAIKPTNPSPGDKGAAGSVPTRPGPASK